MKEVAGVELLWMNVEYYDFAFGTHSGLLWAVLGITTCCLLEVESRPGVFTFLLEEENISKLFL